MLHKCCHGMVHQRKIECSRDRSDSVKPIAKNLIMPIKKYRILFGIQVFAIFLVCVQWESYVMPKL